jgi:hypothetical protein
MKINCVANDEYLSLYICLEAQPPLFLTYRRNNYKILEQVDVAAGESAVRYYFRAPGTAFAIGYFDFCEQFVPLFRNGVRGMQEPLEPLWLCSTNV